MTVRNGVSTAGLTAAVASITKVLATTSTNTMATTGSTTAAVKAIVSRVVAAVTIAMRDCGCGRCGDDCHCMCCVDGADLVVETRLGERRVVTLEVVNERRRERDITLELGAFTTQGR